MGKHAIIIIKNNNNEYLQYYDNIWESFLFLNCKLFDDKENENNIKKLLEEKLKRNKIERIKFLGNKIHKKYSESAKKEKEYNHYFFEVKLNINDINSNKEFKINDNQFCWLSAEELRRNERIMKVNSDIVDFVNELYSNSKSLN